jgi:hypothetical protein
MSAKLIKSWLLGDPLDLFVEAVNTLWGSLAFSIFALYFANLLIVLPEAWSDWQLGYGSNWAWFLAPFVYIVGIIALAGLSLIGWPLLAVEFWCLYSLIFSDRPKFWIFWTLVVTQFALGLLVVLIFPDSSMNMNDWLPKGAITLAIAAGCFALSLGLRRWCQRDAQ